MKTDFRAFFLLVKSSLKLGEIQFLKNILARGSLFMVGETDFPASGNHFSLHFKEAPLSFSPSGRKVFFIEILHSSCWKPLSFTQSFSSNWKPSLKLMEANF